MADSKITALTSISTSTDPAVDPLVIVDVSDTSMAATGTTKKVTLNQLLGSGGTATLASATITGDLTVSTNRLIVNSAGVSTGGSPAGNFGFTTVGKTGGIFANKNAANQYLAFQMKNSTQDYAMFIDQDGVGSNSWSIFDNTNVQTAMRYYPGASGSWIHYINGSTAMTLNSTGLGVGKVPASNQSKVQIYQALGTSLNGALHITDDATTSFVFNNTSSGVSSIWTSGALTFSTGSNAYSTNGARMTLDASGNLLVGTTSVINSARLSLKASSSSTANASLNGVTGDTATESLVINKFDSNSTTSQIFVRFTNNNGAAGSGQINGNGANQAAFGSFSDSRLKENIASLPSQLANILSLRPVEFDYKDGSGHQIGFVAQEMQEVYSDAVGEQNGFLTITGWSKTEARLVSAIKELAAKVQALEAKLA